MTTHAQNLILTVLLLLLAGLALVADGLDPQTRAVAVTGCLGIVAALWRRSGRDGDAAVASSDGGAGAALVCLALLVCACESQAVGLVNVIQAPARNRAELLAEVVAQHHRTQDYSGQAGLLVDLIEMRSGSVPTCTSGRTCLYVASSDSAAYIVEAGGTTHKLQAAKHFRTSANCSGLSSPAVGDVCYDTGSNIFRFYDTSGWETFPEDDLVVHLAGSETITGAKTFNAAPVFAAGLTASGATAINWSGSSADFSFSTGDLIWNGAAGKDITLTQGVSTSGSPYGLKFVGGAHTTLAASTEAQDVYLDLSRTVQFATGALATQRAFYVDAPTYAFVGASTLTTASTVAISGAPVAGTNATITNAYALHVESGITRLAGAVSTGGNISMATTTTLAAGSNTLVSGDKLQAEQLAIASQATGDLLYASSGTAWSRLAAGTSGYPLLSGGPGTPPAWAQIGSAGIAAGTLVYDTVTGGARGALGAATGYASAPGVAWSTTTEPVLLVATRTGTARNLYCDLGTAPGGADTVVITVRKNAADQATTCTISAAGTTCSDTSNTFAVAAGNRVSIKGVSSAGTAADLHCSFEVGL